MWISRNCDVYAGLRKKLNKKILKKGIRDFEKAKAGLKAFHSVSPLGFPRHRQTGQKK